MKAEELIQKHLKESSKNEEMDSYIQLELTADIGFENEADATAFYSAFKSLLKKYSQGFDGNELHATMQKWSDGDAVGGKKTL